MVVSVLSIFPKLIKSCSSDDQSWINFNSIRSKIRIFEKFFETFKISLNTHVWQIWHHMSNNFICAVFGQSKGFLDSLDGMPSVGISGNIFVDWLNTDLDSGTTIWKHVRKVSFLTEIRSGLNGDSDTFLFTLFRKLHSFFDVGWDMSTQGIMEISDKVISVFLIKWHECSTHHNEFDFINIVTDFLQLFNSISGLNVRIVSGTNGSHGSWFITCIRLSWVLKVTVRSTRTVNTNVACCCDMRTSVGFAHNCDDGDSWGCSDRLSFQ